MNARATFADRVIAQAKALEAGRVDLAAIAKLRAIAGDVARLALEGEQLANAFPSLEVNPTLFAAVRGQMGMAWHELELALAALPLELVNGEAS